MYLQEFLEIGMWEIQLLVWENYVSVFELAVYRYEKYRCPHPLPHRAWRRGQGAARRTNEGAAQQDVLPCFSMAAIACARLARLGASREPTDP